MPSNTLTEWPPPSSSTGNGRNCIIEQLKQKSKHSRWSCLRRLPPMDLEILHLAWYAPKYIKEPKMLNIRGKPNIYKIQGLLFWTNLAAITEECFLWLLLCSLPFIYIEQKANNIFLPCFYNCLQMVQNGRMIRLEDRLLSSTEQTDRRILLVWEFYCLSQLQKREGPAPTNFLKSFSSKQIEKKKSNAKRCCFYSEALKTA